MARNRPRSRRAIALGVTFGVMLIAALMTPTIVRAVSSSPTTQVRELGATRKIGGRLVMAPVPAGVRPKINADAAVAQTIREDRRLSKVDSVDATLALITDEQYGRTNPDNSVTPYYKNHLAWVIAARGVTLSGGIGGPVLPPGSPLRNKPRPPCTNPAYFIVDATSGAALYAIQDC